MRKAKLLTVAILVGLIMYAGEGWLIELNRRLEEEHAHQSLIGDVFKLSNLGAITQTDIREGTVDFQLSHPIGRGQK